MKPWAYLAIIVAIIAAFGATYAKGHSSGYDTRDQQVQQEIIEAQEQTRAIEEQRWRETVDAAKAEIVIEERIVEKIREVEIEIPGVVREIIVRDPSCADLGDPYARLLNDQIRASNGVQSPEPAGDLVDPVP